MNPILAAIEQRRREMGMSPAALAKRSGLHKDTVRLMTRQRRPQLLNVEAFANTVGLRLAVEPIAAEPLAFVRWRGRR